MSSLGSLMGGGKAESNDSLKYVAPRAPKKGGKSKSSINNTQEDQPKPTQSQQQSQPQPSENTSKVLASAAVRLYQLNSQTRAYDAVNSGNPLGCVIVGMNLLYQILVYDGQKIPHATAAITKSFKYNLKDLYISFSDTTGNNFSILFDSTEVLNNFSRQLMAVVCHVNCHGSEDSQNTVIGHLPPTTVDSEHNATSPLIKGAWAGCRFKAWDVCENAFDNPSNIYTESPFLESSDVTKIKVGGGEDPVGGMGDALVGLKKNDRVIIGIPTGTAYMNCSGDLSLRKRPGVWVLIEMEIVKVRTEKKDKKKEAEEEFGASKKPFTEDQHIDDPGNSRERSNSLSQRMANLAKQSGVVGVNLMKDIASPSKEEAQSKSAPVEDDFERQKKIQQEDFERKMELQKREQDQEYEKRKLDHERKQFELDKQRQEMQYQQEQQQLALVEGQEVRSYYVPNDSAASYIRQHQHSVRDSSREDFTSHFTNLQQTILSLQTSVMGIHSKIDGLMTTKDSSSNSDNGTTAALLQQMQLMQQQQQMAAAMFNPNVMYGGQMAGNQMRGLYNSQMGGNYNNMQVSGQNTGHIPRGAELIDGVKALVDDFAKNEQDLTILRQGGSSSTGSQSIGTGISEQKWAMMEEKLESLLAKNEKIMGEKAELRERNADLLESSAENASKASRLQREVENLKRQKDEDMDELEEQKRSFMKRINALNTEIESLTLEASSNRSITRQGSGDKERLDRLKAELEDVSTEKSKLQTTVDELEGIMISSNKEWQARLEALTKEKADSLSELKAKTSEEISQKENYWEKERLQMKDALVEKDRVISSLREEKDAAEESKKLSDVEDALRTAIAEKNSFSQRISELEKTVAEQEEKINDLSRDGSTPNPQEMITEFVQDLFGRLHFAFVPPDSSSIDLDDAILSPNAVLKKCKKVLKQGASEFAAVPTNADRSTFVKLSR